VKNKVAKLGLLPSNEVSCFFNHILCGVHLCLVFFLAKANS
jgi:hypothetical protein